MVANLLSGFTPPVPMRWEDRRMYAQYPRRPMQQPAPAPAPVTAPPVQPSGQPAPQQAPVTLNTVPPVVQAKQQFPMGGGPGAAPHRAGYDPDVQKMIDSLIQQGASPYGPFTGIRKVVRDPRDQQSSLGAGNGLLAMLQQFGIA